MPGKHQSVKKINRRNIRGLSRFFRSKNGTVPFACIKTGLLLFAATAILIAIPTIATAASYTWSVSSGNWSDAVNWGGTEPTSSDSAYIQNGGTATVIQTGETCKYLYLGAANSGTIEMTSGSLNVSNYSYVGYSGTGTFTQSGGTNSISSYLYLGYNSGASGTYNLNGSGLLSAQYEYIGSSGTGTFEQTDGTNSISLLILGDSSKSSGTYNLSGTGLLSAASEYIGGSSTGIFTQSGGTNSISSTLYLGNSSGATGT